jgi:hypothetical protein
MWNKEDRKRGKCRNRKKRQRKRENCGKEKEKIRGKKRIKLGENKRENWNYKGQIKTT